MYFYIAPTKLYSKTGDYETDSLIYPNENCLVSENIGVLVANSTTTYPKG